MLLMHGGPDSAYLWRHQIPFLTGHGFRAIAPDMRGFGRSSRPAAVAGYALANAIGDMTGLLDALSAQSAHVVGHDWGKLPSAGSPPCSSRTGSRNWSCCRSAIRARRGLYGRTRRPGTSFSSSSKASQRRPCLRRMGLAAPVQVRRRRPGLLRARPVPKKLTYPCIGELSRPPHFCQAAHPVSGRADAPDRGPGGPGLLTGPPVADRVARNDSSQ